MNFMFDTNAFDKAIENLDEIKSIKNNNNFYMTYVQEQELMDIPETKRAKMLSIFSMIKETNIQKIPTNVFLLNHTPIGSGRLGNGKVYEELLNEGKTNVNDALIGETAVTEGYVLVTNDKQLYNKLLKYDIKVMTFEEFLSQTSNNAPS